MQDTGHLARAHDASSGELGLSRDLLALEVPVVGWVADLADGPVLSRLTVGLDGAIGLDSQPSLDKDSQEQPFWASQATARIGATTGVSVDWPTYGGGHACARADALGGADVAHGISPYVGARVAVTGFGHGDDLRHGLGAYGQLIHNVAGAKAGDTSLAAGFVISFSETDLPRLFEKSSDHI